MQILDVSQSQEILTVSQLNREVRSILEGSFSTMWVEGEISNFAAPNSGHWYFSLKDAAAQVRCAMFRLQNRKLNFTPTDGMHVIAKVNVSLYEGRGEFQLLVEFLEEIGEGKLRKAFEALKKRLFEKGLFDPIHKKPIPKIPRTIGIITSSTGAAIRDILHVLKRRFSCVSVIIYPTVVQGELAAPNIAKAIQTANQRKECDVLIVARGGGSLEDLWPFNEEIVAQAIFDSGLPIISGVGHEIDFTIADFVADLRAPTPSAAAELAAPHCDELLQKLKHHHQLLYRRIAQKLQEFKQNLTWINKHLQQQHPARRLAEQTQQLDLYELALVRSQAKFLNDSQTKLEILFSRLMAFFPLHKIHQQQHGLDLKQQNLKNLMLNLLQKEKQRLSNVAGKLDALSPLNTLQRGYAIATKDNVVIRDADQVRSGDKIQVQLWKGNIKCKVD